jgi:hypothetical protein
MSERDKFLTEAMGGCWHDFREHDEYVPGMGTYLVDRCTKCKLLLRDFQPINFSTWEGFGKLWEWAQKQDWWESFVDDDMYQRGHRNWLFPVAWIHPDRFADALYKFLKARSE